MSKEKKSVILHLVTRIWKKSGIMSVIMNYYRHINREKIQFDFLCLDDDIQENCMEEIHGLGGEVYRLTPPNKNYLQFRRELSEFCVSHYGEYEIIHNHDVMMSMFYCGIKRKIGAKKMIVHAHNTKFSDTIFKSFRNKIFSLPSLWEADYYFACSGEAGEKIFGKKFHAKGEILYNAIDLERFSTENNNREKFRIKMHFTDAYVVGHVGSFNKQKNHHFIIEIFEEVKKKKKEAVLVLVGDGETRTDIENLVCKKGLEDSVFFMGLRNDVEKIVPGFDCFLFPSFFEGLGIAMIEAQACGVRCVYANTVPLEADLMRNINSRLSLKEDKVIWCNEVIKEQLRPNVSVDSQIMNYDIKFAAPKLEKIYQKLENI